MSTTEKRRNIKIQIMACLLCWLLAGILLSGMQVFADDRREAGEAVVTLEDAADLFDDRQEQELYASADKLASQSGWDVMLVTTENAHGKEAVQYIEDFCMDHYRQDDIAAFLIDMDNRELRIATSGAAILYLTDTRIDRILDDAYDEIGAGNYAECMLAMIDGTVEAFYKGIPGNQYMYYSDTGEVIAYQPPKMITLEEALIALAGALLCALGFSGIILGRYRMKTGKYKYKWREHSQIVLSERSDDYLREVVTHRHIPKNPPPSNSGGHSGGGSSGRSTVHHGSGGHTFGGGGRKF